MSERQSYPLNFRQLEETDARLNAPFADGCSTRYSEIITLFDNKKPMSIVPVIILVAILAACALTAILNGRVIVRAVSVMFAVVVIAYVHQALVALAGYEVEAWNYNHNIRPVFTLASAIQSRIELGQIDSASEILNTIQKNNESLGARMGRRSFADVLAQCIPNSPESPSTQ